MGALKLKRAAPSVKHMMSLYHVYLLICIFVILITSNFGSKDSASSCSLLNVQFSKHIFDIAAIRHIHAKLMTSNRNQKSGSHPF